MLEQEVVYRFENQENATMKLEQMKNDNEKKMDKMQEKKDKCEQEFEELKYSGETELSRLVIEISLFSSAHICISIFSVSNQLLCTLTEENN